MKIEIDQESFDKNGFFRFMKKVYPYVLYVIAAGILLLQFSLTFDNVLWGDEAFAASTVKHDISGILQIVHFWDSHPPFYYFWLRTFTLIFGFNGWALHFASYICFFAVCIFAMTVFRKRYGKRAALILIIFTGLSSSCAEYVQEIRMYELAFMFIFFALYALGCVIRTGRMIYYVPAVICALGAAYSHYYALMLAGIMLFFTGVIIQIRFGGKSFLKGIISIAAYVLGYIPWIPEVLYKFTERTGGNWWMTANSPVNECIAIMFGSLSFFKIVLITVILGSVIMFLLESGMLTLAKDKEKTILISAPVIKDLSAEMWIVILGIVSILAQLAVLFVGSRIMVPMIAKRYLYPCTAIVAYLFAVCISCSLSDVKVFEKNAWKFMKAVCNLIVVFVLVIGLKDFRIYRSVAKQEKAATEQFLGFIDSSDKKGKDLVLVNNGVTHIGWTVLEYYYPDAEIINGGYDSTDADDFWLFSTTVIDQDTINHMTYERGYNWDDYNVQQISKYPCFMYHFYK